MKINSKIFLAALVTIVLIGVYYFQNDIFYKQNPIPTRIPDYVQVNVDNPRIIISNLDTSDWKVFNGPGFTVKHPKDLRYVPASRDPDFVFPFTNAHGNTFDPGELAINVGFSTVPIRENSLEQIAHNYVGRIVDSVSRVDLIQLNDIQILEIWHTDLSKSRALIIPVAGDKKFMSLIFQPGMGTQELQYQELLKIAYAVALTLSIK